MSGTLIVADVSEVAAFDSWEEMTSAPCSVRSRFTL
jgi:hypothetical protein